MLCQNRQKNNIKAQFAFQLSIRQEDSLDANNHIQSDIITLHDDVIKAGCHNHYLTVSLRVLMSTSFAIMLNYYLQIRRQEWRQAADIAPLFLFCGFYWIK